MNRKVSWFSCGAASAIATKLSSPDVIAYCETGSEHEDNKRFMADCEKWFKQPITLLSTPKFKDTWEVWEKRKYISGIAGAPCTGELKVKPRLAFEMPDDIHIFGYTADSSDVSRAKAMGEHWPNLKTEFPLIERGLTKAACFAMLEDAGLKRPIPYDLGFHNSNCKICPKSTSPSYYALVRQEYPEDFKRMVKLSRELDVRLVRIDGERSFIDEIPLDQATVKPIAPECDFLCSLAEQDFYND